MSSTDLSRTPSDMPNSPQSSYHSITARSSSPSIPLPEKVLHWDNHYGPTRLLQKDLKIYHEDGLIPPSYRILLPTPDDRPNLNSPSYIAFWHAQFEAGLRLPAPKFLCQISNLYKIPLNQFVPNAIRMMISFYALIKGNGGKPIADLFFSQFTCKSTGPFFYV